MEHYEKNKNKWQQMPAAAGAIKLEELDALSDERLLQEYMKLTTFWINERGWEYKKYCKMFKGKDVVEVGSGLGFDGMIYQRYAKSWTYVDITDAQINFLKRINRLFLADKYDENKFDYIVLKDPINQEMPRNFQALYSHGVLHHVPLEFAKKEFKNFNRFLTPDAKVVFLMYPKERWETAGKPSFEKFGNLTDFGCPWAEYYDREKIMELVGDGFEINSEIKWGHNNTEFVNYELTKKGVLK